MATRHFDNATLGAIPESLLPHSLLMNGYATPLRLIRTEEAKEVLTEEAWPTPGIADSGNIGRCLRWALAIEGGAVLLICAIWALSRLAW